MLIDAIQMAPNSEVIEKIELEIEKLEQIKYKGAAVKSRAREGEAEILQKQFLAREQNLQKKRGIRKITEHRRDNYNSHRRYK